MPIQVRRVTPLLQVFDTRKSVAWYRDVLGFEVLQTHEPDGHFYWAMLKLGDSVLMLNSRYEDDDRPATQPDHVPGHEGLTLYFDCLDVDAAYAHLRAKGCQVKEPQITYYGMKQLTVRDLDGFALCFQQPAK